MTADELAAIAEDVARLTAERDQLRQRIADAADRQEAYAGPAYAHFTEAARIMFRHAAAQLRAMLKAEAKR